MHIGTWLAGAGAARRAEQGARAVRAAGCRGLRKVWSVELAKMRGLAGKELAASGAMLGRVRRLAEAWGLRRVSASSSSSHSQLLYQHTVKRTSTRSSAEWVSGRTSSVARVGVHARDRLSGRAHAHLEAPNLLARVLGVGAHRRGDDAPDVVGEVGARADAAEAVLGAVARTPGGSKSRVAVEAGERLRCDAARGLHEPYDDLVTTSASW